jgi:hypothetical protein
VNIFVKAQKQSIKKRMGRMPTTLEKFSGKVLRVKETDGFEILTQKNQVKGLKMGK